MSVYVENGSGFWSRALENMRARINQSQEVLDKLAKTDRVWDPYPHLSNSLLSRGNDSDVSKSPPPLYEAFPIGNNGTKVERPETEIGIAI